MDFNSYVDRLEQSIEDPEMLERIRGEAAADENLSVDEKDMIGERAGTYIADLDRQMSGGEHTPDTVPDEG